MTEKIEKDNFAFLHLLHYENDDPFSEYLILCAKINRDDNGNIIWQYCMHEHNFTPVYSTEYGSCSIKKVDLEKAMKYANEWLNSVYASRKESTPPLFLIRTHSTKPWQESKKLSELNDKVGLFDQ